MAWKSLPSSYPPFSKKFQDLAELIVVKCSFCKIEIEKIIKGPHGLKVCFDCVKKIDPTAEVETTQECSFCNKRIGKKKWPLSRKKIVAVYSNGEITFCWDCHKLCLDIIEEERVSDLG